MTGPTPATPVVHDLDAAPRTEPLTSPIQAKLSELLGHRPEPVLVLLMELRRLHRVTAGVSADWELLAQGAQAVKDQDLLTLSERCHPQTLRQLRWSNAMLKHDRFSDSIGEEGVVT